jgi:hypothetical protein
MPPKRDTLKLLERYDVPALSFIIDNFESFDFRPETDVRKTLLAMRKYQAATSPDGTVEVSYKRAVPGHGRFFADRGMQGMPREIRNAIASNKYWDVDVKNCAPTLLLQRCRMAAIPCPRLDEYCRRRDEILAELQPPPPRRLQATETPKAAVIALINGGMLESRRGVDMRSKRGRWLAAFSDEMHHVREKLLGMPGSPYLDIARRKRGQNGANLMGCALNYLLCDLENEALMALREFVEVEMKRKVGVLVFDGCMIERLDSQDDEDVVRAALQAASDYVFEKTGYRLTIVIKPMIDRLHVPVEVYGTASVPRAPRYAMTDEVAAGHFIQDIAHIARQCNGEMYLRHGIAWTCNEKVVDNALLGLCLKANILNPNNDASLSANVPTAKRIITATKALLPDDASFQKRLWESNIGVLCYSDGVYDFKARRFFSYEERPDVLPVIVINRKFPAERPPNDLIHEVRSRLLLSTLGDEAVVDTYLALVARALAAAIADKQWAVMLGERNCGKGLIQEMNEHAFDLYVNTVNANAFL